MGGFLHRVGAEFCSECRDGTLVSAIYYSYRASAYQKAHETPYFEAAQASPSLVFDRTADTLNKQPECSYRHTNPSSP